MQRRETGEWPASETVHLLPLEMREQNPRAELTWHGGEDSDATSTSDGIVCGSRL